MNLYLVISEALDWQKFNNPELAGPWETYRIAELVVARNHSQARYLAWQSDKEGQTYDFGEMPKLAVRLKGVGMDGPARIASDEYNFDYGREGDLIYEAEHDILWDIGKALHIGIGGEE